ncbi:hypothetical protein C9374_006991 [Naegleria lovaniensis]|uniref:Homeobox domain-containing protein n=1 Tax=Naegleria lovaniensis TaxID=51637 RepID=A0AA88KXT3_NAELO|nr:uncharacterized protein C9374_006991 [Naegleria lovaniensis]KAG2393460.1 hypothetical protein C9374_006991 [Naegleria lovaniensis]
MQSAFIKPTYNLIFRMRDEGNNCARSASMESCTLHSIHEVLDKSHQNMLRPSSLCVPPHHYNHTYKSNGQPYHQGNHLHSNLSNKNIPSNIHSTTLHSSFQYSSVNNSTHPIKESLGHSLNSTPLHEANDESWYKHAPTSHYKSSHSVSKIPISSLPTRENISNQLTTYNIRFNQPHSLVKTNTVQHTNGVNSNHQVPSHLSHPHNMMMNNMRGSSSRMRRSSLSATTAPMTTNNNTTQSPTNKNCLPSIAEILRNIEDTIPMTLINNKEQHSTREWTNTMNEPNHVYLVNQNDEGSQLQALSMRNQSLEMNNNHMKPTTMNSQPTRIDQFSPHSSLVLNHRNRSNSVSSSAISSSVQSANTSSSQMSNRSKNCSNSSDSTLYKNSKISKSNNTTTMLKKNKRYLSDRAVKLLKEWLFLNWDNPYPDSNQKRELAKMADISVSQVNNFFINARRRICKKFESPPEDHFN